MIEKKIVIREATPADVDQMIMLLSGLFTLESDFDFDCDKQRMGLCKLLIRPSALILVATYGDEVMGMCTVQTLISTAEGGPVGLVEDVVVKDQYQAQGVGRRLLKVLQSWCKQRGFTRLQLLVDKNNINAIGFYKHMGWQSTDLVALRLKE